MDACTASSQPQDVQVTVFAFTQTVVMIVQVLAQADTHIQTSACFLRPIGAILAQSALFFNACVVTAMSPSDMTDREGDRVKSI